MKIIQDNPYRLLGVYTNSPKKDRMANLSRMRAFLKVGKQPSSNIDMNGLMPPVERSEENVTSAEASLTLPKGQMRYAQFWFIKSTPLDEVAFNHLKDGETAEAVSIWQKRTCASSLQNRIVVALIKGDIAKALSAAEVLYNDKGFAEVFFALVTGEKSGADAEAMGLSFIDTLADEIGASTVMRNTSNTAWRLHTGRKASKQLSDSIFDAIGSAKMAKSPEEALDAAKVLRSESGYKLTEMREIVGTDSQEYQMTADKLADAILQCSIYYYNRAGACDSLRTLKELIEYAMSIATSQFERDRCGMNLSTLQRRIDSLPPENAARKVPPVRKDTRGYVRPEEAQDTADLPGWVKWFVVILAILLSAVSLFNIFHK